jgi:diguanylate cyclase (GGDEF)-like protein
MRHQTRLRQRTALLLLAAAAALSSPTALASVPAPAEGVERRHPLEIEALTRPREVLAKLAQARKSLAQDDHSEAAKLALAEANACRVIADYRCQRRAGSAAIQAADRTVDVYLQVRARIAVGRALSRLGDFNAAARVLAEAQQRLGDGGENALHADVLLAYSSISERLGKLDESYRYAREGLAHASADELPEMRLRLLRNMANIASRRGRPEEARALMREAKAILPSTRDPKLAAEVLVEEARSARALGDADTVEDMGRRIGTIGDGLRNTQLRGLGLETRGHAQRMRGDAAGALALYRSGAAEFARLELDADELRALREVVDLQLAGTGADDLPTTIARLIQLSDRVNRAERDAAAADFEERLRYAESDAELARANAVAEAERLRAEVTDNRFRYSLLAGTLAIGLLAVMVALYAHQRRYAALMRERGREMEIAASTDFLTSVHSRRFITEAGARAVELARAEGGHHGLAVAIVDVDHFKRINDRYGHAVGDEALKAVAAAMRAVCREGDLLGRYGGEEFAVLLRGIGPEHAVAAAERLRRAVAGVKLTHGEDTIAPTASIGVATLVPQDRSFEHLLTRADHALYRAKAGGRNRVEAAAAEEAAESTTPVSPVPA